MQIHTIQQIHYLQGHKGGIYTLCHGFEDNSFLSAGSDGLICKWNPDQNQNGVIIAQTGERLFSLLAFPAQKVIFAGTMQGDLFHLNFKNEQMVKRFKFHQPSIYRLAEWKDLLIVAAGDGIISIWNPENGDIINHLKITHQKLRSLDIDTENDILYTGDANGNLWILKLPEITLIDKIQNLHDKTIFSIKYLQTEKLLVTGGLDAHIKICDGKGKIHQDIQAHWFCVNDICDLTGTPFMATASRDKTIRIWDKRDWSLVKEISSPKFATHLHSVNSLLWKEEELILYSAGDDGNIFGWKFE